MSEITHSDELVTKTDLSNFYQTILPYLGGMPEALANKFNKSDLYSTDEKIIGQWIDGKPLYQKVVPIVISTPIVVRAGEQETVNKAHGISNIGTTMLNLYSNILNGASLNAALEFTFITSDSNQMKGHITDTEVSLIFKNVSSNSWTVSTRTIYAIIRYTKTTDSVVSIGNDTDYSTTEKIVGTWIDGKPIYQKTFETTTPSDNNAKYVSIGASIDKVICIHGFCLQQGGYILPNSFWATSITNSAIRGFKVMVNNNSTPANPNCLGISAPGMDDIKNQPAWITIQYTKTS